MYNKLTNQFLLKWVFIVLLSFVLPGKSNAQAILTDVVPDYVLNATCFSDSFDIDFDHDGIKDVTIFKEYDTSGCGIEFMSVFVDSGFIAMSPFNYPYEGAFPFSYGDVLDTSCLYYSLVNSAMDTLSSWSLTNTTTHGSIMINADFYDDCYPDVGCGYHDGIWLGATGDYYLGVKFLKGGQYKFGWIRINNKTTIMDYAYEESGNGILAGMHTAVTGLPEETVKNGISVFPNPSTSVIKISGLNEPGIIDIYDVAGRMVFSKAISKIEESDFDVSMLQPGIYSIHYLTGTKSSVVRFVKEE